MFESRSSQCRLGRNKIVIFRLSQRPRWKRALVARSAAILGAGGHSESCLKYQEWDWRRLSRPQIRSFRKSRGIMRVVCLSNLPTHRRTPRTARPEKSRNLANIPWIEDFLLLSGSNGVNGPSTFFPLPLLPTALSHRLHLFSLVLLPFFTGDK